MFKRLWEQASNTTFKEFFWKEDQKNRAEAGEKCEVRKYVSDMGNYSKYAR